MLARKNPCLHHGPKIVFLLLTLPAIPKDVFLLRRVNGKRKTNGGGDILYYIENFYRPIPDEAPRTELHHFGRHN